MQAVPPRKRGRPKGRKANSEGSENPSVRRPVGRPRGSGHKQREAAAQAAERAALGLVQTQAASKRHVGRPRKDREDGQGVSIYLQKFVSLLKLVFYL